MLTGTAGAAFLGNPDCTGVPTRKINSSENLAPEQAAPGMVFPGECCTLTSAQELLNGRGKFLV